MPARSTDRARVRNGVFALSGAAWILLLLPFGAERVHVHDAGPDLDGTGAATFAAHWLLMLAAMMLPPLIPVLYSIRAQSLRRRRSRSTVIFLVGYAAIWIGIGQILSRVAAPHSFWPALLAAFAAVLWQCSPAKQRCLNRCHSHPPLPAFGFAADRGALLAGTTHGFWCAGSCWAWMLCPMLLPYGQTAAMVVASVLIWAERIESPAPPRWAWRGIGRVLRLAKAKLHLRPKPSTADSLPAAVEN